MLPTSDTTRALTGHEECYQQDVISYCLEDLIIKTRTLAGAPFSSPSLLYTTRTRTSYPNMSSQYTELDALQLTLNHAIDTFRRELVAANLPPLSSQATEPHPLDDCTKLAPPRLYEARRLALGESKISPRRRVLTSLLRS